MKEFLESSGLETSYLRELSERCARVNGINLSQGVCEDGTPDILIQEAVKSIQDGNNCYVSHLGIDKLREVVASRARRVGGTHVEKSEIVISNGATGALICTLMALFERGDEVLVLEPFYPYHVITLRGLGLTPIVAKYSDTDFRKIDFEYLESLITSKTKAILICTPSNPTGKVLTPTELNAFAQIADKHQLYIISDEIYEHITYDKSLNHTSALSLRSATDKIIAISGFSKTFAVTGWRIGYAVSSADIASKIGLVNDFYYVCAPSAFQFAVANAYEKVGEHYFAEMRKSYMKKRDFMVRALQSCGMDCNIPEGSYYLMADSSMLYGRTSVEKALYLLESTGVAAVPGENFYMDPRDGDNLLRFCFAKSDSALEMAYARLASAKLRKD